MIFRRFRLFAARAALVALASASAATVAPSSRPPETDSADAARFLDDVALLITDAERAAFVALPRPYQQRAFIRRFWEVRDPYPQTVRNELAERWRERLTLARERYRDPTDDRARMLLWNGDPERVVRLRCPELLRVGEAWVYRQTDAIPGGFALVFLTNGVSDEAPHRLWSSRAGYSELFTWQGGSGSTAGAEVVERIRADCPRGDEILDLLAAAADWDELAKRFEVIPKPNPEWVRTFEAHSTEVPSGAGELPATVEVRFSGRNQSRTIVDAAVLVAAGDLPPADEAKRGDLVLDGELLRNDELFDHFRYRFDRPRPNDAPDGGLGASPVPFAARRYLRPGTYRLVLRLQDSASGRYFRSDELLVVPPPSEVEPQGHAAMAPMPQTAPTAPMPALPVDSVTPAAPEPIAMTANAPAAADPVEPTLRLLAPTDQLISGRVRIEADVRGWTPARVEFALDGQLLLSRRRGPFAVDLDLGRIPRLRRVSARAYDAGGAMIAEDELVLNGGPHRFAVRIVEPERAPRPGERVMAQARVDLPEGETFDRLEFYLDDERLATLYQPPYSIALAAGSGRVSYLRAVAYLSDGAATEDVRLLAGGDDATAVEVDFVELYTTVLDRRGRAVTDLGENELRVREDGEPQTIRRFEHVDSAPIHAGVMIDTSASMMEELRDAEAAAERFFREILTERDRAAVITFADSPRLAARFTSDVELLAGGLADLEAEGETRFYDALAYALHYFSGVRGKRAIVILSDFADSGSKYRMDEIVDYARRTGVAIYGIGLNVPREIPEAGMMLDRLARETGGRAFRISRVAELGAVYEAIRAELRAQYLIAYQSSRTDGSAAYRTIEVEVERPGAEARTLRGYYP